MARILVIDDDPEVIGVLTDLLGDAGHDVVSALHGGDGLMVLSAETFDVVLLDFLMPGIDGWDVLRRIRMLYPELRVIVITGHGTRELADKMLQRGAFDYIPKPFDLAFIASAVSAAIERCPWKAAQALSA